MAWETDVTLTVRAAGEMDASAIAHLRTEAADALTRRFGQGPWSGGPTEARVLWGMSFGRVLVAVERRRIIGALLLATRRPWSDEPDFFTPVERPIYLTAMAVLPRMQAKGVGRSLLDAARDTAKAWPAQAIRLDAYDAPAGAGEFYVRCGFREVGRGVYRDVPLVYCEQLLA